MKTVVCIFAHPDDEAFGPGGTIAKLARTHAVYILCATRGEAGKLKGRKSNGDLRAVRSRELLQSAKILGVRRVFFLGFRDGTLSNNLYHKLAARIERIVKRLRPDTLLTFEPRGISGHIDHVTVSMVSTFVFERLKFIKTLLYFCITEKRARGNAGYFIYFPPGYKKQEIDRVVDIRGVWEQKLRAMLAHKSQIHDVRRILRFARKFPKQENFLVRSRR